MEQTIQDFFHDFKQGLLAGAESSNSFQLSQFVETIANELTDTGFLEGFEPCHYRAQRGMRVDGYWFNDEGALDLFVADFDFRENLASLTRTDVDSAFKRVAKFFEASKSKELFRDIEETAPEYGLSRQICDRGKSIRKVSLYLLSERTLSERISALEDGEIAGIPVSYHIISGTYPGCCGNKAPEGTRKFLISISRKLTGSVFHAFQHIQIHTNPI